MCVADKRRAADAPADVPAPATSGAGPTALGFVILGSVLATWTGGTLGVALVVVCAAAGVGGNAVRTAALLLAAVVPLRAVLGAAGPWEGLRKVFRRIRESPWFASHAVVGAGPAPLAPRSRKLLAVHPHGALSLGTLHLNATDWAARSGLAFVTSGVLLSVPLVGDFLRAMACVSAEGGEYRRLCERGTNLAIQPGGFDEAAAYVYGKHVAFIRRRKGFIAYALRHGYTVYPAYTFGEERTYSALRAFARARAWLAARRVPGILMLGWRCTIMPYPVRLTTVIGDPLALPHVPSPTPDEVDRWHAAYVDALVATFDANKAQYAAEGRDAVLHVL